MKRCLLAAIFLFASLAAARAAETPSELKPFVRGSWQQMLRSHAGRPTLVHFWGVTCGPCKVELPLLGQFMKDHSEIDVVMISADLVPNLPGRDARDAGEGRAGVGGELDFQRRFCRTPPVRDRSGLAGRDPAHAADRAGRNGHHDRGFGRNTGPREVASSTKSCNEMRNEHIGYCGHSGALG